VLIRSCMENKIKVTTLLNEVKNAGFLIRHGCVILYFFKYRGADAPTLSMYSHIPGRASTRSSRTIRDIKVTYQKAGKLRNPQLSPPLPFQANYLFMIYEASRLLLTLHTNNPANRVIRAAMPQLLTVGTAVAWGSAPPHCLQY
jgi:hypothetical protein